MDHAEEVEALPTATAEKASLDEQESSPRGKKRVHPEQIYAESISGLEVTWNDKDAVVTFLKSEDDCRLCLVGRASLTCLEGDLKVLGYHMTQDMSVEVTSPSWSSFITVTGASLNARLQLVSIRPESDRPSFRLVSPVDSRPTVIPQSWSQAVDQISQEWVATRSRRPETSLDDTLKRRRARVVVCGAKGVGKSTCVRYTVNRLLKDYPQVAILDADVGQPELSPPGVLTLSVTTRPLLAPPRVNLMRQNREIAAASSLFFGCITHKVDPSRHMDCLAHLTQQCEMQLTEDGDETQLPLVVNLDGWVKGIGHQVLTALLLTRTTQAPQITQTLGKTRSKQFELTDVRCPEETKLHAVDACTNSSDFHNWSVVTLRFEVQRTRSAFWISQTCVRAPLVSNSKTRFFFETACSTSMRRTVLHHPTIGLVVQPQLLSPPRLVDCVGLSPISTQERRVGGQWKVSPSILCSNLD